ncbi:outer membrane beta-barrel protein [Sphingobacterium tabacisoli]|uniref:Outer membrane beta-barrel protein n=1 Tax=Sphingobacterium tabacisoli TaxID=2044855 RepID=A0ABW5L5I2_9SPHI|nr:outer membrane beta-barrel protein [Sphingobacterium tabacisoli]
MKKIYLSLALALGFGVTQAQETHPAIQKGKIMVETNFTPFGTGNSGFSYSKADGAKSWQVGASAGYFVMDKLAFKAGIGYTKTELEINFGGLASANISTDALTYQFGAKYYIINCIPVQVDFNGAKQGDIKTNSIGGQLGYAWFIRDNMALEPAVKYNLGVDDNSRNVFSAGLGFSIHF